jgi:hypothetical protein
VQLTDSLQKASRDQHPIGPIGLPIQVVIPPESIRASPKSRKIQKANAKIIGIDRGVFIAKSLKTADGFPHQ